MLQKPGFSPWMEASGCEMERGLRRTLQGSRQSGSATFTTKWRLEAQGAYRGVMSYR